MASRPGRGPRPGAGAHGTTLEGILERAIYVNEANAWTVVRVAVPGKKDLVTVVGNLLGVQPGENLRLRGSWTHDRKYGEQFKADGYVTVKPATLVEGEGVALRDRLRWPKRGGRGEPGS